VLYLRRDRGWHLMFWDRGFYGRVVVEGGGRDVGGGGRG